MPVMTADEFIEELRHVKFCKSIVQQADDPTAFVFGCSCAYDFVGFNPETGKWHTMQFSVFIPSSFVAIPDLTTVCVYDTLDDVLDAFKEMYFLYDEEIPFDG